MVAEVSNAHQPQVKAVTQPVHRSRRLEDNLFGARDALISLLSSDNFIYPRGQFSLAQYFTLKEKGRQTVHVSKQTHRTLINK